MVRRREATRKNLKINGLVLCGKRCRKRERERLIEDFFRATSPLLAEFGKEPHKGTVFLGLSKPTLPFFFPKHAQLLRSSGPLPMLLCWKLCIFLPSSSSERPLQCLPQSRFLLLCLLCFPHQTTRFYFLPDISHSWTVILYSFAGFWFTSSNKMNAPWGLKLALFSLCPKSLPVPEPEGTGQ